MSIDQSNIPAAAAYSLDVRSHVGTIVALPDPSNRNPGTGWPVVTPVGAAVSGTVD